jgi:hypothetical protein
MYMHFRHMFQTLKVTMMAVLRWEYSLRYGDDKDDGWVAVKTS